jgi:integrase
VAKITKRFVDGLSADDAGRIYRDDEVKGFAVRRNGDGSITYLCEYRAGHGRKARTRRMSIGGHGVLTPDEARKKARLILSRVLEGFDPAGEREADKREPTVADILRDALAKHWRPKRRPSTAKSFGEMIERTLIPEFGSLRLSDLTRKRIREWHARNTHRTRQANLDLAILRKALSLAVADELISDNAAKGITPHPERARERVPTDDELRRLWRAIDATPVRASAARLFKLLALTGCRRGEWQTAQWRDVDFSARCLRLAEAKAGARVVPLSEPVLALLRPLAGSPGGLVCPGDGGDAPLTKANMRDAWAAVLAATGIEDLRIHDLRHAFATRGASLGASALILRDALGHKTLAMTSRYVARQIDPVRTLADRVAAEMLGVVEDNGAAAAEAIEFEPAERKRGQANVR